MITPMKRIIFNALHGDTDLLIRLKGELMRRSLVSEVGFIAYNWFWYFKIKTHFPFSPVWMAPGVLRTWVWRLTHFGSFSEANSNAEFQRALKNDRILTKKDPEWAFACWGAHRKFIQKILKDFKPDAILSETVQSLPCFTFFLEAFKLGIPYAQVTLGRSEVWTMHLLIDLTNRPFGIWTEPEVTAENLNWARDFVQKLRETRYKGPSYMEVTTKSGLIRFEDLIKLFFYILEMAMGGILEVTRDRFLAPITSKLNAILRNWNGHQHVHDPDLLLEGLKGLKARTEKKLYFPLHITPEASTLTWANHFSDMGIVVAQLLRYLPKDWILVIKEHPSTAKAPRDPAELTQILKSPRVVYLGPSASNQELLQICDAVTVVTGTLGLEALALGKRVITLGDPFYDLSGCTAPCQNLERLPNALKDATTRPVDDVALIRFLAQYHSTLMPGIYFNPDLVPRSFRKRILSSTNIGHIADFIESKLVSKRDPILKFMKSREFSLGMNEEATSRTRAFFKEVMQ